jgi:hypothetical protein
VAFSEVVGPGHLGVAQLVDVGTQRVGRDEAAAPKEDGLQFSRGDPLVTVARPIPCK